jgi:hypothetical protein
MARIKKKQNDHVNGYNHLMFTIVQSKAMRPGSADGPRQGWFMTLSSLLHTKDTVL